MKEKQLPTEDAKVSWKTKLWNAYLASIPVIDSLTGYGKKYKDPMEMSLRDILLYDPSSGELFDESKFLPRTPKK